jgi:hypothetical protein
LSINYPRSLNYYAKVEIFKKLINCWAWWFMPVSPALKKLRQEDQEFKVRLGYKLSAYL